MKKLNTALLCASTVLFANSASAGWSIGGFVGQSSISGCRPISIAPVSTLTTSTFDSAAFNEALLQTAETEFPEDIILDSGVLFVNELSVDFVSFASLDSGAVAELFDNVENFTTNTQTSFIGTIPTLEDTISAANERIISADFTTTEPVAVFEVIDSDSDTPGAFDASSLGEFLVGATDTRVGTTTDILIGDDGLLQSFTSADNDTTQSLEITNALFECDVDDDSDIGFGFNVAYNFTKNWGIEAGYVDLGEFSATTGPQNIEVINPQTIDIDASAFYLAGTASYYYSKKWSVTGRLGAYQIDVDSRFTSDGFSLLVGNGLGLTEFTVSDTSITSSFKDEDIYYGASLNYDLNEKFQVQLRYDDFDIDLISLGLRYNL